MGLLIVVIVVRKVLLLFRFVDGILGLSEVGILFLGFGFVSGRGEGGVFSF